MAAPQEKLYLREPCPWRILEDCGGAFVMGAVGGAVWHGVKGYRNGPSGQKLRESLQAIKLRSPTTAGSFAVWGGMFATIDCTLTHLRGKEDSINSVASGALTGGLLSARMGVKVAAKSAFMGGVILACIEGFTIMMNRFALDNSKPMMPELPSDPLGPAPAPPPAPGARQAAW